MTIQRPSIVLPQVWTLGTETETVNDLLVHTSIDIIVEDLQEKLIQIIATEVVVAGTPGPLWYWVELSPVDSDTSTAYWSAIGGGGGALAPLAPEIEVATGVTLTVHTMHYAWTQHSAYARVIVQTPVSATPATAYWAVQCLVSGKY